MKQLGKISKIFFILVIELIFLAICIPPALLGYFPGLLFDGKAVNGEIVSASYRKSNQTISESSRGRHPVTTEYKANVGDINYTYQCQGRIYKKNKTILFKRSETLSFEKKYNKGTTIPLKINPDNCSLIASEPNHSRSLLGPTVLMVVFVVISLLCGGQLLIELGICKGKDQSWKDGIIGVIWERIYLALGLCCIVIISPLLLLDRKPVKILALLIVGLLPAVISCHIVKDRAVQEFRERNWVDVTGTVVSSSLVKTDKTTIVNNGHRARKEVYVYKGTVNYSYECQAITYNKIYTEDVDEKSLNTFKETYSEGSSIQLKINPEDCSDVAVYDTSRYFALIVILIILTGISLICFVYCCLYKLPKALSKQEPVEAPDLVTEIFKQCDIKNISPELINVNNLERQIELRKKELHDALKLDPEMEKYLDETSSLYEQIDEEMRKQGVDPDSIASEDLEEESKEELDGLTEEERFWKGTPKEIINQKMREIAKEIIAIGKKYAKHNSENEDENNDIKIEKEGVANEVIDTQPSSPSEEDTDFWKELTDRDHDTYYEMSEDNLQLCIIVQDNKEDNFKITLMIVVAIILMIVDPFFIYFFIGILAFAYVLYRLDQKNDQNVFPKHFDKLSHYYWEGKERIKEFEQSDQNKLIRFSSIKALQVLKFKRESGFQLNFVLDDDSRKLVVSSNKLIEILKIADKVAGLLGIPVIIDKEINKYSF